MKLAKCLLFLLMLGFLIPVHGQLFLSQEPSGINHAYSGNAFGTVNIWHNNPLTAYSNPAVPAFYNGLSWAISKNEWQIWDSDIKIINNVSMISYAQNGLSIILPAPNSRDQFGITVDYGHQDIIDSSGQLVGRFRATDNAQIYGMAINPFELYRKHIGNEDLILNSFDLALGAQLNRIEMILPIITGTEDAKGNSVNIGAIARVNHTLWNILKLEGVCGYSHLNVGKGKLESWDDSTWPLDRWESIGLAFSGTLKAEEFTKDLPFKHLIWFDDALALRYFNTQMKALGQYNTDNDGYGVEIGLFDTFFFRYGHTDDGVDNIVGNTSGWGIKLHYKNIVAFSYNRSKFPWGRDMTHESDDLSVNIDIIKLSKLFR